jgi:hypothetical protein
MALPMRSRPRRVQSSHGCESKVPGRETVAARPEPLLRAWERGDTFCHGERQQLLGGQRRCDEGFGEPFDVVSSLLAGFEGV